ncbi:MAG: hypothetical protein A2Z57_02720 [Planctomycetes bacterium RIFCSPHIGHO2_12_39_6]|nr:MAG: hypothetical protein A2Z57_02720 [Planctomycetes bacterium RIFCSPHIGHO2_12_39_6]
MFDYLNKNLMYEVRFTILNPKSEIVNMVLSASGTCRGRAATTTARIALRGGVVSTASYRHPKHRKYLMYVVALAGRAK